MTDTKEVESIESKIGQINTKPFWKSKTLWFNVAIALFTELSSHTILMQSYLSDGLYMTLLMVVAAGNVALRSVTTQGVTRK